MAPQEPADGAADASRCQHVRRLARLDCIHCGCELLVFLNIVKGGAAAKGAAMRDMKAVIRACTRAGLVYTQGRKHGRITDPQTGRYVTISCTPSCPTKAARNILGDVRRYLGIKAQLP